MKAEAAAEQINKDIQQMRRDLNWRTWELDEQKMRDARAYFVQRLAARHLGSHYEHHDFAHQLLRAHLLHSLKEGGIGGPDLTRARDYLGSLYYNPPSRVYGRKLKAAEAIARSPNSEKIWGILRGQTSKLVDLGYRIQTDVPKANIRVREGGKLTPTTISMADLFSNPAIIANRKSNANHFASA